MCKLNFLFTTFCTIAGKWMKESRWAWDFPESASYMTLLLSLTLRMSPPHIPRPIQKNQPTKVPIFTLKPVFRVLGGHRLLTLFQETA